MTSPKHSNHPHIEMVTRSILTPNPDNARIHSDKQLHQIAASIKRFGFVSPIVIDDDNIIRAGHGRWEAAGILGIAEVPALRIAFVSKSDARAFALADNRIAELSDWDDQLLQSELGALFELDYDFEVTGFDLGDLDFSIGDDDHALEQDEDCVELPNPDTVAVSRPGDLWLIGPHRIYCGSALELCSYETLLGESRASMIFADPPYNVPIGGHVSGLGKAQHKEFAMASGEMSPPEFIHFLRSAFKNCVRFSSNGSIHFHCMDWRHIREIQDAAEGVYIKLKQLIAWKKSNAGMGSFYRSQHELIFAYKSGKGSHVNNFGLGETGRYRTNVWEYAGANTFRKDRDKDLEDHPTVKPLAMVMDAILDCSHRGDIILDPFLGSGTSLIAAHRTGRIGVGIEIDPAFVDVALRRLSAASGLSIIHLDGRSLTEIETERFQ